MTTTQPDTPDLLENLAKTVGDARTIAAIRHHLDRQERGGATVVRIEHLRAILGRRGR